MTIDVDGFGQWRVATWRISSEAAQCRVAANAGGDSLGSGGAAG